VAAQAAMRWVGIQPRMPEQWNRELRRGDPACARCARAKANPTANGGSSPKPNPWFGMRALSMGWDWRSRRP